MRFPLSLPPHQTLRDLAESMSRLASSVASGWNVEHNSTGRHVFTEHTFTPSVRFGLASSGITMSRQDGLYTRIGHIIIARFRVTLASVGTATGDATIHGFPAAQPDGAGNAHPSATFGYYANFAGLTSPITGWLFDAPDSHLRLYDVGATGVTALLDTNFTASSDVIGSVIYTAADPA